MSKKKITLSEWILRALITVLFCVALFVGWSRLDEWHEMESRKAELEKQKTELQQFEE